MKKIFIFFLFLTAQVSLAKTIYVTPTGISNWTTVGAGSQTMPYNLQYGINAAAAGDVVLLQGTFSTTASTGQVIYLEKNDITIGSWGTGGIIEGRDLQGQNGLILMVIKSSSNVVIKNLTFQNNYGNAARGVYVWGKGTNVTVQNCKFQNIGWTKSTTAIAPAGIGGQALLFLGNKNDGTYGNVKALNNTITNCFTGWSEALTIAGNVDGFEISGNTISNITNIGIDAAGHFAWVADWDTNEPLNASLNQSRNGKITNNKVSNCVSPIATSSGIYCDGCRDTEISRNLVNGNGAGISVGCEVGGGKTASNVKVINNIIMNSKESGIFFGSSISEGTGESWVENSIVRNNTFFKNGASDTSNDYEVFVQNARNSEISHNIIFLLNTARGIVRASGKNPSGIIMDYNLFYRANNVKTDLIIQNGLTTFQHGTNAYFGNPKFVNTTDFKLNTGSPAINSGKTSLTLLTSEKDYHGANRKQSTAVDFGAAESAYTTAATAPNLTLTNGAARISAEEFSFFNEESATDETVNQENLTNELNVSLFPNPALDNINISFDKSVQEDVLIQIIDVNGNIWQSKKLNTFGGTVKEFNIPLENRLPNTPLYIRTITNTGVKTNALKVLK